MGMVFDVLEEEYLKALYVQHDRKPPFVHDLLTLARGIGERYPALARVSADCERLTPFGTVTRYPGSIMEPGLAHMPQVTAWMENIRSVVRSCLNLGLE